MSSERVVDDKAYVVEEGSSEVEVEDSSEGEAEDYVVEGTFSEQGASGLDAHIPLRTYVPRNRAAPAWPEWWRRASPSSLTSSSLAGFLSR